VAGEVIAPASIRIDLSQPLSLIRHCESEKEEVAPIRRGRPKDDWRKRLRIGVPPAIERSRSGKGAHAWFFFSGPVAASVARQMGCHLLTETMSYRHS